MFTETFNNLSELACDTNITETTTVYCPEKTPALTETERSYRAAAVELQKLNSADSTSIRFLLRRDSAGRYQPFSGKLDFNLPVTINK